MKFLEAQILGIDLLFMQNLPSLYFQISDTFFHFQIGKHRVNAYNGRLML